MSFVKLSTGDFVLLGGGVTWESIDATFGPVTSLIVSLALNVVSML